MLEALRRGVRGIFVQILLALLVVSFAVWGVADVFRGYGQGAVAKVGKTEISTETFQQALQNEITNVSRQFGQRLTMDQARAIGLDQRVITRLAGSAALDTHALELGLALPDSAVAEAIRTDAAFQGIGGAFSREYYTELLRQSGLTEQRYFAERRAAEIREQLTETITAGNAPPSALTDTLHRFREETRTLAFLPLDVAKLVKLADPDEAALKVFYEASKREFVTPELRKVPVILLTNADVRKKITVSDEDVKAAYEQQRDTFSTPERRRVLQLPFPDRAAAEAARAELAKAATFTDGLAALKIKESDVDLGTVTEKDMIDKAIAAAAFKLAKDATSEPIAGTFSTVLLRVTEIVPGKVSTLDEVKQQIVDRIAGERAGREIQAIHDKIDDARAGGVSLKEIADKLGVRFVEVAATDKQGRTADGKPALEHPEAQRILATAFEGAAGLDREPIELQDGGFAWVDIGGITPERQKAFDEVKDQAKDAWRVAETRKALNTAAANLVERLSKGETLEDLAKELGGDVKLTQPLKRNQPSAELSRPGVQRAFSLPKGGAAHVDGLDGKSRTLIVLRAVVPPPAPTPEQAQRLKSELQRQLQSDVVAAYVNGLQERLGFTINQAAYRRTLGLDRTP